MAETAAHRVETRAEVAATAQVLVQHAERQLRIFTRDLDAPIYSTTDFCQAISALVRRHRAAEIRILIQDPTPAIRQGHQLIELIQRLTSYIGVRRVASEWADEACAFLLADSRGLLWRPRNDRMEGESVPEAGPRALKLRRWFDEIWEQSLPDPEFRRLSM